MTRCGRIGGALTGAALSLSIAWSAALAGEHHQVIIEKFAFMPASLTIKRGDTVEFINKDIAPHTATADGDLWDTGELAKGRSVRFAFTDAGTSSYHCVFHPHMKAEIVVTAN